MPALPKPGWLLGRRFACDFRVAEVRLGPDGPVAILEMYGERYEITVDELQALVARGFVVEVGTES